MKTFKQWLIEKNPEFITETSRRGFLKAIAGLAATSLLPKISQATDWKEKGYKEITNDPSWKTNPSHIKSEKQIKVTHEDLLNNVHNYIRNDATDKKLKDKKRDELVPGKDYRIFEIIPEKILPYLVPSPEKFQKDFQQFIKDKKSANIPENTPTLASAQLIEPFKIPQIVIFINSKMHGDYSAQGDSQYAGLSTILPPLTYDNKTDSYDRNSNFMGRTLLGRQSIIIPIEKDLKNLDFTNLPNNTKKILAHEIRHGTQINNYGHLHALNIKDEGDNTDRSRQQYNSYLGNPAELGVRIAALKDNITISKLKNSFDEAINQTTYSIGTLKKPELNFAQKTVWVQEAKKLFDQWLRQSEKTKAIDLLTVYQAANKLGYSTNTMEKIGHDERERLIKAKLPTSSINAKQKFINSLVLNFIQNFFSIDSQMEELLYIVQEKNARSGTILSTNTFELYASNQTQDQYTKQMIDYVINNWNYIVHKSFHKEFGIA